MKAIVHQRYGSPDVLALRDVQRPAPGRGEVLVRVHAVGINPADCAGIAGIPHVARLAFGLRRPRRGVPGQDLSGVVEAVGPNATRFAPGDEVFGSGTATLADYAVARESHLAAMPDRMDHTEAAAVPMAGMAALQALRDRIRVRPGQRVLVTGAGGGIGSYAVQIAVAAGAHVTGVCSAGKAGLVRSLGAIEVIDYARRDFTTGPDRWDAILDNVSDHSLSELRRVLTPDGVLVPNGGQFQHRWTASLGQVSRAAVLSPFLRHDLRPFLSRPDADDLATLAGLADAGSLRSVVDRVEPLAAAADAVRHVAAGHTTGKVVVTI